MATPLFVTFNDLHDLTRAARVRKALLASGRYTVSGFWPYTRWMRAPHNRTSAQLAALIDRELEAAALVVVLIGADTAGNEWVRYTIGAAHAAGKPMFGLYVHEIADERGRMSEADAINPFERFAVLEGDRKVYLSERYRTHVWLTAPASDPVAAFDGWAADAMLPLTATHETTLTRPVPALATP